MTVALPQIYRVSSHTDHVGPGSTYVVIQGQEFDGATFVAQAIERGATKIVVQIDHVSDAIVQLCQNAKVELLRVPNALEALATMSAHAYDFPARKLKIIGITGTDGKTTSVYLCAHILRGAGHRVALLSGVQNYIDDIAYSSPLTTAKADYLHMFLHECVQAGVEYVVMEVSAQAFTLNRVDHVLFDGIIFTNLAQEHAEWYADLESYFATKARILDHVRDARVPVVAHADNEFGRRLARMAHHRILAGFDASADYRVEILSGDLFEQRLTIVHKQEVVSTRTSLVGQYNAQNIIAVVALVHELGVSFDMIAQAILTFVSVPGRFERYRLANGVFAIVDYAHTPQACEAVLQFVRQHTRRISIIFGASGGKDHVKRPLMGAIASRLADQVILTTDNPRTEDVHEIARQIAAGVAQENKHKLLYEFDRAAAIKKACMAAGPGDVVLVVGKGIQECQIIGNQRIYHSDRAVVQSL